MLLIAVVPCDHARWIAAGYHQTGGEAEIPISSAESSKCWWSSLPPPAEVVFCKISRSEHLCRVSVATPVVVLIERIHRVDA